MTLPFLDVCLTLSGYSGEQDFDDIYLGHDRFLPVKGIVSLEAHFDNDTEVDSFWSWWETEAKRGKQVFLAKIRYFGSLKTYGMEQVSAMTHTLNGDGTSMVAFEVRLVVNADDIISHAPPVALGNTVYVDENTADNYIKLSGMSPDNLPLEFVMGVPPAFGTLKGTPPALLYTPDQDFKGEDCMSFYVKDYLLESKPAVININVGSGLRPNHLVKYKVSGKIRVNGNFHYSFDNSHWVRGFGGYLDSPTGYVYIASLDHELDARDDVVDEVTIETWGDRVDYREYLKGKTINIVATTSTAGECKGEYFDSMFEGVTINEGLPDMKLLKAISARYMFKGAVAPSVGMLTFGPDLLTPNSMFEGAKIPKVMGLEGTSKCPYFTSMYQDAVIDCIGKLDTTGQVDTSSMFDNATITSPDSAGQALLIAGGVFDNIAACGVRVTGITQTGNAPTCEVSSIGGTCVSKGTYTVVTSDAVGASTYVWSTDGVIVSGQGTDTVEISTDSGSIKDVVVTCAVTDTIHTDKVSVSFQHLRTYAYLNLELPKSYSQISLKALIDANNPQNKTEVLITNRVANCSVTTGDLSGLAVTFVNRSYLDGIVKGRTNTNYDKNIGFVATTPITVNNLGYIRGAGGYGGLGSKAPNYVKTISHSNTAKSSPFYGDKYAWTEHRDTHKFRISWNWHVSLADHSAGFSGPTTLPGEGTAKFYRGARSWVTNDGWLIYSIKKVWTTTTTYVGRGGGLGGRGAGYGHSALSGAAGLPSSPAGGYTGGRGGTGGSFGASGSRGLANSKGSPVGSVGYAGAPAVKGNSHITWDSKGHRVGAIT